MTEPLKSQKTYQASMHTYNLVTDDCDWRQAVEDIRERFPYLQVVSTFTCQKGDFRQLDFGMWLRILLAFVCESVARVYSGAFVISAKYEEILWILDSVEVFPGHSYACRCLA